MKRAAEVPTPPPPPGPWVWGVLSLLGWAWILALQNPGLAADDSGEMAVAAVGLQSAHPPGYPLWILLGRLACLLPLGTPAFRLNLLSAGFLLAALWVAARAAFTLPPPAGNRGGRSFLKSGGGASAFALVLGALVVAAQPGPAAQAFSVKGGLYTLNALFGSLLLVLLLHPAAQGFRGTAQAALLAGLALAHHWPLFLLWTPAAIFLVGRSRPAFRPPHLPFFATLLLLGLSPYLVLPLRAAQGLDWVWGDPSHGEGFRWVVFREFAGPERYLPRPGEIAHKALRAAEDLGAAGALAAALFLLGLIRHSRNGGSTAPLLLLVVLPFAAVLWLLHPQVDYLLAAYLVSLAGVAAFGVFAGARGLTVPITGVPRRLRWVPLAMALLAAFLLMRENARRADRSRFLLAEDFGRNILQELPRGAVFLAEGDHPVFAAAYLIWVRGLRPDVRLVPAVFLLHPWGWEHYAARAAPPPPAGTVDPVEDWAREAARRFPLRLSLDTEYLERLSPSLVRASAPAGLVRLPWNGAPAVEMSQRTWEAASRWRLRGEGFGAAPLGVQEAQIPRYYADAHNAVVPSLLGAGREEEALVHLEESLRFSEEPEAFANLSYVFGRKGAAVFALWLSKEALERRPESAAARANRQMAFALLGGVVPGDAGDQLRALARRLEAGGLFRTAGLARRAAAEFGEGER